MKVYLIIALLLLGTSTVFAQQSDRPMKMPPVRAESPSHHDRLGSWHHTVSTNQPEAPTLF